MCRGSVSSGHRNKQGSLLHGIPMHKELLVNWSFFETMCNMQFLKKGDMMLGWGKSAAALPVKHSTTLLFIYSYLPWTNGKIYIKKMKQFCCLFKMYNLKKYEYITCHAILTMSTQEYTIWIQWGLLPNKWDHDWLILCSFLRTKAHLFQRHFPFRKKQKQNLTQVCITYLSGYFSCCFSDKYCLLKPPLSIYKNERQALPSELTIKLIKAHKGKGRGDGKGKGKRSLWHSLDRVVNRKFGAWQIFPCWCASLDSTAFIPLANDRSQLVSSVLQAAGSWSQVFFQAGSRKAGSLQLP